MPKYSTIGGLNSEELKKVQRILGDCENLERAQIFGSRAMNTHKPSSDVDLALFGEHLSRLDVNALKIAFEDSPLPHTFDLILHRTIKEPELLAHIQRRGMDVYREGFYLSDDGEWIPDGWITGTFGHNGSVQTGFAFKSIHMGDEGIPLIKITEIQPPYVNMSGATRVAIEPYSSKNLRKFEILKGDSLVAMTGATIGKVGKYLEDEIAWLNQRVAKISGNESTTDNFIHYVLKSNRFAQHVTNTSSGSSAQQNISGGELEAYNFPLPPLSEQKAIADVLSSLDDKVELLREQNEILEALAQTLFKRWFIDFNFPDENGNPYKDSGGEMVASEFGEIPTGWKIGKISIFAEHVKNSVSPEKSPDVIYCHYSIPSFDDGMKPVLENGEEIKSNKYEVVSSSILVSKLNPISPRIWQVQEVAENSVCSTEFQVVKPHPEYFGFVYGALMSSPVRRELAGRAHGTSSSHQRVSPSDIFDVPFPVGGDGSNLEAAYSARTLGLLKKSDQNRAQIQTLTRLRDTLLPKLMKGEIRIPVEA